MKVTNINILFIPISGKNEVLSVIPEYIDISVWSHYVRARPGVVCVFGPIRSKLA